VNVPGHLRLDLTSLPGTAPLDHDHLPGLEDVMIVGAFVLDIVDEPGLFRFLVNAALRRTHPWYEAPDAASAHCFRRLLVTFRAVRRVTWFARSERVYYDAERRMDRGCIDAFVAEPQGRYLVEGDWGGVTIESASPTVHRLNVAPEAFGKRRLAIDAWLAGAGEENER
jgi:hypothetical protein